MACTKCACMVLSLYNAASREDYVRVEFNARYEKKAKPMVGFKDKLDAASSYSFYVSCGFCPFQISNFVDKGNIPSTNRR